MFRFSEDLCYFMPAHFGNREGPPRRWTYDDVTSISISYETDADQLSKYVPEGFELTQPVLMLDYEMNRGVEWMAGGSYNIICAQVPVVCKLAAQRLEGWFALVVWENKTCPILPGREITGIPKIFADIQDHHQLAERAFTNASYEGATFLRMDFRITRSMTPEELAERNESQRQVNWFGWRYIPNIGKPGAALSHATLYPVGAAFKTGWIGDGRIQWTPLTREQHPTQAHIIEALAGLPIKAYLHSEMALKTGFLRDDLARALP